MSQLRDKDTGCEWDKEQTYESIAPYTIEEAYEVVDAIERSNVNDLKEELGDLLLQVVFLSQIAKEREEFQFEDVVLSITEKLIRRHPYVFSQKRNHSSEEQASQWEEIKSKERAEKKLQGAFDDIPMNLPSLKRSQEIQKRSSKLGFDWPDVEGVFEKVKEEICELEEAIASKKNLEAKEEIGYLFMIITKIALKLDINSEEALRSSNNKFIKRFSYIEKKLKENELEFSQCSLTDLDLLWEESKKLS